jgi:hypothetical protein
MRKLIVPMLVLAFLSCTQRNADISRVTGAYYDKGFFNTKWRSAALSPDEWYYRTTVVDTPTNTEAASIASGHWLHPDVVRFEVTEKFLIGWRSHATVPGSENDLQAGAQEAYRGEPVAVFPITDHFDIAREYDPVTTDRSNIISENHDRMWDKRRYMRVDFTRNLAREIKREDDYAAQWATESLATDVAYSVGQSDPANPKRSRFEGDYFEVTTRQGIKVDYLSFVGAHGHAYRYDNASPVVDIRTSFKKKIKDADYEALAYPDQVYLVDDNGKEIRDRRGISKTENIWPKFGFYRNSFSGQQNNDARRGSVESNTNYNITRFNVWKQTYRNGVLIPLEQREPKPIVYYTNVEHPTNLLASSQRVASQWDRVFREMVYYAQPGKYKSITDVPQMWVLKENDCNATNVQTWLNRIEDSKRSLIEEQAGFVIDEIKTRINAINDSNNAESFTQKHNAEAQAKADLERICSALEFYTQGSSEAFRYQRSGDQRYNLMNLVTKQAQTSWSGLGPMFADSLSGEILQAQANVNLWYIDSRAAWASRQIDMMNGRIDPNNILFGTDIKKAMADKMAELKKVSQLEPSQNALKRMDQRFFDLSKSGELLVEVSPKHSEARSSLMKPEILEGHLPRENDLTQEMLSHIAPLQGHDLVGDFLKKEDEMAAMAKYPIDPPEIIDPLVVGLAIKYSALSPTERFYKIREEVYTAVMLHEIGHNMGLAHNMAGSSDALNYGPLFWQLQNLPSDLDEALAQVQEDSQRKTLEECKKLSANYTVTAQECLGQDEIMYSSIMDYHAAWNSDLGGLGTYDKAAIKFGYAQLVETFPKESMLLDPNSQNLKKWLDLNDWKKIPTHLVNGIENIGNRTHEKYEWQSVYAKKPFPSNAVPYRYCMDSSGKMGPFCKAFDFGPDMKSQAKWNEIKYWQHYYFTHFASDRVLTYKFDFERIVSRDLEIMSDYTRIMRWYYFLRSTSPDFVGSDAEKDYLSATVSGLNHFAHVISLPAPGQHVSVPLYLTEGAKPLTADADRLSASRLLLPWGKLDTCVQANVAQVTQKIPVAAKPGYVLSNVKLGDGRPFYVGLTNDYEENYVSYVGSFFGKLYAGFFLSNPSAWFPRTEAMSDPRAYAINWHRLFPKEVGKLFSDLMTENWGDLGPLVDSKGKFMHRNLLDPVTLQAPDYSQMWTVMPGNSTMLPYKAMYYASALLSGNKTPGIDPVHSMNVSLDGGIDDVQTNRGLSLDEQAIFQHPITGNTYRALNIGDYPVAFNLINRLNVTKEKYERLSKCVDDPARQVSDTFCYCIKTAVEKPAGGLSCCQASNSACPQIGLSKVGEGVCSQTDLRNRREQAREEMELGVGFIDDMRWFYENYARIP